MKPRFTEDSKEVTLKAELLDEDYDGDIISRGDITHKIKLSTESCFYSYVKAEFKDFDITVSVDDMETSITMPGGKSVKIYDDAIMVDGHYVSFEDIKKLDEGDYVPIEELRGCK